MKARKLTALLLILNLTVPTLTRPALAEKKYIPVINGQFSTGQYYFEGDHSQMSGNADLSFVPAIQFSESSSLIPAIESHYRGTRSLEELAGGTTLFQDTWENGISLKAVQSLGEKIRLRERMGYSMKWFRETTDEEWTDGLYDYNILTGGLEVGYRYLGDNTIAVGYDHSFLKFPNYQSLESTQSGDSAREFSGSNVLDNTIGLYSVRGGFPLGFRMKGEIQTYYSPRDYSDQTVVLPSGLLSASKREDLFTGTQISLERPFTLMRRSTLIVNLVGGMSKMDSNQNHYDAPVTTFIADFYDYEQNRIGGKLTYLVGGNAFGPLLFETGYAYSKRDYTSRVIQDEDGAYLTEKLYQKETTVDLGFSYPLARNFRLRVSSSFGKSRSNNQYEAVYRYNYDIANYQFGFTYDY